MNDLIVIFILASLMMLTFIIFCLIELIKIIKEEKRMKSISFKEEDIFDKSVFDKLKQSVNELKKIELKVNSSFEYNLNKSFENLKKKIK
jgi:hypothetical protein